MVKIEYAYLFIVPYLMKSEADGCMGGASELVG